MPESDVPQHTAPFRWFRIVPSLLLHAATLLLVSVVMTTLAFGFHDYYRHANIDIPAATLNVIRLAEICHVYWLPLFCVIMIVDAAIMFFLTSWPRSKRWPLSAFSQLFVFASLVLVAYVAVWLGNPIIWEVP